MQDRSRGLTEPNKVEQNAVATVLNSACQCEIFLSSCVYSDFDASVTLTCKSTGDISYLQMQVAIVGIVVAEYRCSYAEWVTCGG